MLDETMLPLVPCVDGKSADHNQLDSDEASWSGSTLFSIKGENF